MTQENNLLSEYLSKHIKGEHVYCEIPACAGMTRWGYGMTREGLNDKGRRITVHICHPRRVPGSLVCENVRFQHALE